METGVLCREATRARRTLVCALIAAIGYAAVFASSPFLHAHFHSDAGQAQHQCAAVLLSKACENSPTTPLCVLPVLVAGRFIANKGGQKIAPLCLFESRERGPPSADGDELS